MPFLVFLAGWPDNLVTTVLVKLNSMQVVVISTLLFPPRSAKKREEN